MIVNFKMPFIYALKYTNTKCAEYPVHIEDKMRNKKWTLSSSFHMHSMHREAGTCISECWMLRQGSGVGRSSGNLLVNLFLEYFPDSKDTIHVENYHVLAKFKLQKNHRKYLAPIVMWGNKLSELVINFSNIMGLKFESKFTMPKANSFCLLVTS
jgi:hypothetical protein